MTEKKLKMWKATSKYIRKHRRQTIAFLLLLFLLGYFVYNFKRDPEVISYEGVFQRGSVVDWVVALNLNKAMPLILPQWMSSTITVAGESISLRSCTSSNILSLAFSTIPDTTRDWGITQFSQPHLNPSFKVQAVTFTATSTMNLTLGLFFGSSGALEFYGDTASVQIVSLWLRRPYIDDLVVAQLKGKVGEPFKLFLNRESRKASGGNHEYEAKFGEFPSVVLLTDPPRYPKDVGMVGILLQGKEQEGNDPDFYAGGCDKDDGFLIIASRNLQDLESPSGISANLNLAIKSVALTGFGKSTVTLAGQVHSVAYSDRLKIVFDESSPGQLRMDIKQNGPSVININGRAIAVKQNDVSLLPANIESWPWYVQAIVWALIGFLFSLVFEKPLAHLRKFLQERKR